MKERIKSLVWLYQRGFWYIGLANGEIRKPLAYLNEILLLMTFLTVRGIEVPIVGGVAAYIAILAVAALVGKILVNTGIVAYNQRIVNKQNPELMEIIERLDDIERKLSDSLKGANYAKEQANIPQ